MQTRVMVHVFCTLSHGALHWCKFHANISNCIRVMERTQNYEALMGRWTHTRVMVHARVHVFCTLSHGALQWCKFSLNIFISQFHMTSSNIYIQ